MGELIEFAIQEPVERGEGIETVRLSSPPLPGQTFTMGITSFPPGTGLALHSHNTIEQVTILEGSGIAEIDGVRRQVGLFDTTRIPAGESHRFDNTGDSLMRILWVYGSTEVTRTFTETGETVSNHVPPSAS